MNQNFKTIITAVLISFIVLCSVQPLFSENLLLNGDFEKSDLSDWKVEAWREGYTVEQVRAKVHSGQGALMIKNGAISNDTRLVQAVKVKPNTIYKFSGWIASENINDMNDSNVGANICIMGGYNFVGNLRGNMDWTYAEMFFKTHSKQTEIPLAARLGMFTRDDNGTAYFDDLKLEVVKQKDAEGANLIVLDNPEDSRRNNQPVTGKAGSSTVLLWVFLIILVIAVVVVNIVLINLKKKKDQPDSPQGT